MLVRSTNLTRSTLSARLSDGLNISVGQSSDPHTIGS